MTDGKYDVTTEELIQAGEAFAREIGRPNEFNIDKLVVLLKARGCVKSDNIIRDGKRKRGWIGVRLRDLNLCGS